MGRPVRAEIALADREMGRFIRAQYAELRKLGYPRMATFARDIARGDIGMPPPTGEDPLMDAIGGFYFSLREIDRRVLSDKYIGLEPETQRARRVSQSVRQNRTSIERLLLRCSGWLQARGF